MGMEELMMWRSDGGLWDDWEGWRERLSAIASIQEEGEIPKMA